MRKNRIKETDIYNGSEMAKQRLVNLFLYADGNIQEFCNVSSQYRKYIVKTLNLIEENRKIDEIENFSEICNRVLNITEIDNVETLNRLFFNVLASFDAFISYLFSKEKGCWVDAPELQEIISILKQSFKAKMVDPNQDYDIQELLCETRNSLIHNGRFVSKFTRVESGTPNVDVPALVIIPSEIFNEKYCKEHKIEKDYVIDTLEIFNHFKNVFENIDVLFKDLFKI